MQYLGKIGEFFEVKENANPSSIKEQFKEGTLTMIWFENDNNKLSIDSVEHTFKKDDILFLTFFHRYEFNSNSSFKLLRFNKPFYCILDHDSEVGCKGLLFFGSNSVPIVVPNEAELEILEAAWKMLFLEMQSSDNLQGEMLQMMLKRILILCTRIYKRQENFIGIEEQQVDIVRDFNFLVDQHFRDKHSVSDYASLLNKSPKTISNLFGKLSDKKPLQIIQDRIMLEVKRLLKYSDKPISEIGYEVGFSDIQSFSRFFKKNQGLSPSDFRGN